jgi:hypothetical protein
MRRRPILPLALGLATLLLGLALTGPAAVAQTPNRGGMVSNVRPMAPCYSNLALWNPLKALETADTVIPELAEKWLER